MNEILVVILNGMKLMIKQDKKVLVVKIPGIGGG
jgi:hypothetical protein